MYFKDVHENQENNSTIRNKALIYGILFRGLEDFINLKAKTHSPIWFKNTKLVEKLWVKLCDCNDRFNYVSKFATGDSLDWILAEISKLEKKFEYYFGKGQYSSSAFRAKKLECSICENDLRRCDHIGGAIYDGKVCMGIVREVTNVDHVALVKNPADLRCRLWPWNAQKQDDSSLKVSGTMLASFKLDDF